MMTETRENIDGEIEELVNKKEKKGVIISIWKKADE